MYEINHTGFEKLTAFTIAMDPSYKETTVDCRERYEVSAHAAAPANTTAPDTNEPAATGEKNRETAAAADNQEAENARISQSREIAALQREILYENEYNSITY